MNIRKRITAALCAVSLTVSLLVTGAFAAGFNPVVDTITSRADTRIQTILTEISRQTFTSPSAASVLDKVDHFLFGSTYAAIGGQPWPYRNENGYVSSCKDNKYVISGINGSGCFAYSKFVMNVVYGYTGEVRWHTEAGGSMTASGLASFLRTYAQAGEQLRLDNVHSVTFLACDSEGFYYMDYWSSYIRLHYTTFAKWASASNQTGIQMRLYDANTNKNTNTSTGGSNESAVNNAITITPLSYPSGQIMQGASFNLSGTLMSQSTITEFTGTIYKEDGTKYSGITCTPNATYVSISGTSVNSGLKFGSLPAGIYYLEYTVKNQAGIKHVWTSDNFTVTKTKSALSINPVQYPKGNFDPKSFDLTGTIQSNYPITSVSGFINNTNGDTISAVTVRNINKTSFSIYNSGIDNGLKFSSLPDGTYHLIYEASDSSGNMVTWISPEFYVNLGAFTDVYDHNAWYYNAVISAKEAGLMNGVQNSNGTYSFYPNQSLTRAQTASVVYQMYLHYCTSHGLSKPNTSVMGHPFTDSKTSWYQDALKWCYTNKIVSGVSANQFSPEDYITREQAATILFNYIKFMKMDDGKRSNLTSFTDAGSISTYASEPIKWANNHGIISGMGNGTINPKGNCTRAQCASMLVSMMNKNYC